VASCRQGHPVSAESGFCEICGDDVRPRCSQGHRSGVGARFCETCGEPLLAGQDHAAGEDPVTLVLDYRSGPFTDFIARDEPDPASAAATDQRNPAGAAAANQRNPAGAAAANQRSPAGAAATDPGNPAGRPGLPEAWRDARADVLADLPPYGDRRPPNPPPERRRRGRVLMLVLTLVVLAAGGTAGAIALLGHQPTAPQAGTPRGGSAPASQPGSATPTASHRPELPVRASGWTAPVPIDRAPSAGNATITGLSCPRITVCYAGDSAGNVLSSTSRSAARRGPWRVVASDPGGGLVAISCPTARFCLAVDEAGNAITLSHGSWSSPVYVNARSGIFTAVSCPVAAFCMAVDSGGNAFAYAAASNTWQPFTVAASGAGLTGVSCTGPGRCIAVDDGGGAYTYNGRSWSAVFPVDAGHAFTGRVLREPGVLRRDRRRRQGRDLHRRHVDRVVDGHDRRHARLPGRRVLHGDHRVGWRGGLPQRRVVRGDADRRAPGHRRPELSHGDRVHRRGPAGQRAVLRASAVRLTPATRRATMRHEPT
jgi:hypothetical protein